MIENPHEPLKERLLRIVHRVLPYAIIVGLAMILFRDFLLNGYVMDGAWDRRNNVLPYYYIFQRAFQNFEIPQWNPYLFCGNTLFSHSTYVFFYPFNWIIWASPESAIPFVTTFILLIHFVAAGYFMWRLINAITTDMFWSLCGTLSYMLSSSAMMSLFTNTEQFLIFVYGPALMYLVYTYQKRSLLAGFILQTIVAVLLLLGGQVQFVLYFIGFYLVFLLLIGMSKDNTDQKTPAKPYQLWLLSFASLLLSLMISAVRYSPFYIANSSNILVEQSYADFLRINYTSIEALLKMFLPEFFIYMNRAEYYNVYSGVCAAFLGLYAILFVWDKKTWFWKLMVITISLMVIGTPLAYIHYYLTGKSNLAFGRMALLISFCLAVLMSMTGKLLIEDRRHLRRFIMFSVGLFLLIFLGATALYYFYPGPPEMNAELALRHDMRLSIAFFTFITLALIGLFAYYEKSTFQYKVNIFKFAFLAVIVTDLFFIANIDMNSQNPFFAPEPFYQSSLEERMIADKFERSNRSFRILGMGEGTSYNRAASLGIYNNTGFESVPPFYITMLFGYPSVVTRESARHIRPMNQRVLELTSTRYVLVPEGVYEIPSSLPRFALYYEYIKAENDEDALQRLIDNKGNMDISRTVVLDRDPGLPLIRPVKPGAIQFVEERGLGNIILVVDTPENALLLLNDTYDAGWSAVIDGVSTKVIRANYAFRAVAVPSGVHRVLFSFSARGFKEGKIVSSVSLVLFLMLIMLYFWRRQRSKQQTLLESDKK